MNEVEKIQQKIKHSNQYALKNVELLFPDEIHSSSSTRLHITAIGHSMSGSGIYPNDLLIIDRAIEPQSGHIVLALVHGEFTLKRFHHHNGKTQLSSENKNFKSIQITPESQFKVVGVLTFHVHKHT